MRIKVNSVRFGRLMWYGTASTKGASVGARGPRWRLVARTGVQPVPTSWSSSSQARSLSKYRGARRACSINPPILFLPYRIKV